MVKQHIFANAQELQRISSWILTIYDLKGVKLIVVSDIKEKITY